MITPITSGTFPNTKDFSLLGLTAAIADYQFGSVQLNFDLGGRPAWTALKNGGETPLVLTGKLRRSIYKQHDADSATVGVPSSIPYARIHNEGGTIKHPGSDKKQTFQIGGKWITTNHTDPHDIPIPQRKYLMFQEQDILHIKKMAMNMIVHFFDPVAINA